MYIKDKKISRIVAFLLFSIFFIIGVFTFKDYGISVDEEFHRSSGFYWLNYALSFTQFEELKKVVEIKLNEIKGFTLPSPINNPYYGVVLDLPAAFLEVIFKIEDPKNYFQFRHFLNFILFFVGSIFFYRLLLNRFVNYNIALIGTLFFILSPRIYGDSFFNNKDIVFLSLISISLYYCFVALDKLSYKNLLVFSIFVGLSTSQRVIGVFLPISFIFFYFLSVLSKNDDLKDLPKIIFFIIFYFLFSILFWPVLWNNPIENFILAFNFFSHHYLEVQMLFNGNYVYSNFLPSIYIFNWILISSPSLYIILFLIGYFLIFKRFFNRFTNIEKYNNFYDLWRSKSEKKDLFVLFNITSIILYLIAFNAVLYNGWRHLYFLNIFIIYIAIYSFHQINIKFKSTKKFHFIFISIFLLFIVYKMIIYHPFQNIYFNSFFNKNAQEKFEVDYWGTSGKKFLKYILNVEKNKNIIKIATASYLPLERSTKLLEKDERVKISIIGQNYKDADYLYTNFISEVDKNSDDKYKIPDNFNKIEEFILDNTIVYQVFKKMN
tara:strand:- start:597 stop:2243 length:1647 start_codon:yes stop_codon:yes gene_type:complete